MMQLRQAAVARFPQCDQCWMQASKPSRQQQKVSQVGYVLESLKCQTAIAATVFPTIVFFTRQDAPVSGLSKLLYEVPTYGFDSPSKCLFLILRLKPCLWLPAHESGKPATSNWRLHPLGSGFALHHTTERCCHCKLQSASISSHHLQTAVSFLSELFCFAYFFRNWKIRRSAFLPRRMFEKWNYQIKK